MISEQEIESFLDKSLESRVLDLSAFNLSDEQPYFIADAIISKKLFNFFQIDISNSKISKNKGF